jgi:SMC interacting uncharacterized protein involved in chromosome segregation
LILKIDILKSFFNFYFFYFLESPEKSPKTRPQAPVRINKHEQSKEAREVSNEVALFLNQRLERSGISDVSKHVKSMVDKIANFPLTSQEHIEDLSTMIQEFYQLFERRLETKQVFKGKNTHGFG